MKTNQSMEKMNQPHSNEWLPHVFIKTFVIFIAMKTYQLRNTLNLKEEEGVFVFIDDSIK